MELKEFINYKQTCPVCNSFTALTMHGTLEESIGDEFICSLFGYEIPIFRKNFITFATSNFAMFTPNEYLDMDTLNQTKYSTFILDNNIASFDNEFQFKMKLTFVMSCQERHYSYSSRDIRISNNSPDITRGYNIETEQVSSKKYRVISNFKKQTTSIYNLSNKTPTTISFMNISKFPCNDEEKFENKMENILLLV